VSASLAWSANFNDREFKDWRGLAFNQTCIGWDSQHGCQFYALCGSLPEAPYTVNLVPRIESVKLVGG